MVKKIIIFLIFSRIAIYLVSFFINYNLQPNLWLHILSFTNQWDSPHYLFIAKYGYQNFGDQANFIVFMPLYPLLIKILSLTHLDYKISALLISNTCFVVAGYFLYKILRYDYSEKFSIFTIILISIFPTSFFFSSAYPESLFFMLFCLSVYLIRTKKYFLSFVVAGMASITRPFGIAFWPMLAYESLSQKNKTKKITLMILVAMYFYLLYLSINFISYKNPFAFKHILENNWDKSFTPPWIGLFQSWKVTIESKTWDNYRVFVGVWEAVFSSLACILTPFAFIGKAKIRFSYALYYLFGVILFTSTGFILSTPRYLLSLPPFFMILARTLNSKTSKIIWITASTVLLFYLSSVFSKGQWAF